MMDIGDSKNGGAVMVDKSPLKFAMDFLWGKDGVSTKKGGRGWKEPQGNFLFSVPKEIVCLKNEQQCIRISIR